MSITTKATLKYTCEDGTEHETLELAKRHIIEAMMPDALRARAIDTGLFGELSNWIVEAKQPIISVLQDDPDKQQDKPRVRKTRADKGKARKTLKQEPQNV